MTSTTLNIKKARDIEDYYKRGESYFTRFENVFLDLDFIKRQPNKTRLYDKLVAVLRRGEFDNLRCYIQESYCDCYMNFFKYCSTLEGFKQSQLSDRFSIVCRRTYQDLEVSYVTLNSEGSASLPFSIFKVAYKVHPEKNVLQGSAIFFLHGITTLISVSIDKSVEIKNKISMIISRASKVSLQIGTNRTDEYDISLSSRFILLLHRFNAQYIPNTYSLMPKYDMVATRMIINRHHKDDEQAFAFSLGRYGIPSLEFNATPRKKEIHKAYTFYLDTVMYR